MAQVKRSFENELKCVDRIVRWIIIFILSVLLINSCEERPTPPVIKTTTVTAISYTTAVSGGEVTDEGSATVVTRGVCWNTTATPTISNSRTIESGGLGEFTSNLSQLTPGTKYYVRAYATNSAGTGYGNQVSFTTSRVKIPVLTTTAITSIAQTTAVSGGNITDDKGSSVTERGVCWGTEERPTTKDNKTTDGTGIGSFVSNLTGLIPATIYYVRSYATNSAGTSYGEEISFTTLAAVAPSLTTTTISSITQTSARSGGKITNDGGAAVTMRGVCWSTSSIPTTGLNTKTTDGAGPETFASEIAVLTSGTTYFVRAYAVNSAGTGYGNELSFTTHDINSIRDIEGNDYDIITIGTQVWMKENLRVTKYNDDHAINKVTNPETWFSDLITASFGENDRDIEYVSAYGRIYNRYVVIDERNICPAGWHVPTDAEWTTLEIYLGGSSIAGGKLKSLTGWLNPNTGATNESGFSAIAGSYPVKPRAPGGVILPAYYDPNPGFACWWSSDGNLKRLEYNSTSIFSGGGDGPYSAVYSIRCLKD